MVITAANNTRLSRRLFWALILLYVLPGLFARSPWKPEDAEGFGQGFAMATQPFSLWAYSTIGDRLYAEGGLLSAWLSGLLGKLAMLAQLPHHWVDDAMRMGNVFWIILAGWAIWNTTYRLAKRSELQPEDPLGTAPTRIDYARSVADASVLCLLATLGLLLRSHMQVPEIAGLAGLALIMLAAVRSLDRPIGAGWMLGLGILIAHFAYGWSHWVLFLSVLLASSTTHSSLRFGLMRRIARAVVVAVIPFSIWFFWLMSQARGEQWWGLWLEWNLNQFLLLNPNKALDLSTISTAAKTLVWFLWPVLPMAAWSAWRYRRAFAEPAIRIPMAAALGGLITLLLTDPSREANYVPLLAPLAVLAAIGLSTMRRGLVSLIDWFAVLCFTLGGVLVWVGWTAVTFGFPARMAANFDKLSPGYVPGTPGVEVLLALIASYAWVRLVMWRTQSGSRAIWRPMALSGGGLVLIWLLMMTLWMPRIDYAKRFDALGEELHQIARNSPSAQPCIIDYNLGYAQRATLEYHARTPFVRASGRSTKNQCQFLLVQDDQRLGFAIRDQFEAQAGGDWVRVWTGNRNSDRHEFFFLYERPQTGFAAASAGIQ